MARSMLNEVQQDLQRDSGSVLWSFIQGEQLEFEITLKFIEITGLTGFEYEAVIIEGDNVPDSTTPPEEVKANGVQTKLNVRVSPYKGSWAASTVYTLMDLVSYNNKSYMLYRADNYSSSITPDQDPNWREHALNIVYVQFPKELSITPAWAVQPTTNSTVYGFFELRVTEPVPYTGFKQTWKPMRGLVEIQYSPTEMVPDI